MFLLFDFGKVEDFRDAYVFVFVFVHPRQVAFRPQFHPLVLARLQIEESHPGGVTLATLNHSSLS